MSNPNASYTRTPWWEHITTTTKPCEDQPTTTSTPASTTTTSTVAPEPTTTSTAPVPETTTTQTPVTSTTVEAEQPTTTVEVPAPEHRFELTPAGNPPQVEHPNAIHVAVSTPLPVVDAVVLAPPVSYAAPVLPHTGSETVTTAGIGGLLVAVGLICTALAARTRKANR